MKKAVNSSKSDLNVKILVACHRPCQLLKDSVFTPIHVGREIAEKVSKDGTNTQETLDWMKANVIGDNTGDNISAKNHQFNELTAIYWAWKNYEKIGNPDYVGLMHYRRHLCFDLKNTDEPNRVGLIYHKKIDDEYICKFKLTDREVKKVIKDYDVVVAEKCDLEKIGTNSCYNHYLNANPAVQHIEDYDKVLKIILEKYPEYEEAIKTYNSSRYAYFTNIFIMKKSLFKDYAKWIFSIVFEAEKEINISQYNIAEARALGYISEWLFGIWFTHLKQTTNVKVLELKRTFVEDTAPEIEQAVEPAFKEKNIAICLATDLTYIPYLSVTIQSIIDNASADNNYDINILHENIPLAQQQKIIKMQQSNISIRFVGVKQYYSKLPDIFFTRSHFTKAAYNRFFIPLIFKNYEKILYLDSDLVVNKDVAQLFGQELNEKYLVGAVRDFEVIRWATKDKNWGVSYLNNFLGLKNIFHYFQSGVLLLNIKQMINENIYEQLLRTLEKTKTPKFPDQDVFNIVCEDRVLFLDARWNVEFHIPIWAPDWMQTMPVSILYDYIESRENPWVVHFAGSKKPWHNASLEMSEYFWKYARRSPLYEEILYTNISPKVPAAPKPIISKEMLNEVVTYSKHKIRYWRYRILSEVTFGKMRKYYKAKKKALKNRLNQVKNFLEGR